MIVEGFAKRACCDEITKIENYDIAVKSPERWVCHHKLEAKWTKTELIQMNLYWGRPAEELIFMNKKEHYKLHKTIFPDGGAKERFRQKMLGHDISLATMNKISARVIERNNEPEIQLKLMKRHECLREKASKYKEYKLAGGTLTWNEFQHTMN